MALKADDGTILEPKDGVVLSPDEKSVLRPLPNFEENAGQRTTSRVKVLKLSGLPSILVVLTLAGLVLAVGTFVIGVFGAVLLAAFVARSVLRVLGVNSRRAY